MIKITMEILPHGEEKNKYFMGEMVITNIGKVANGNSLYTYVLVDKDRTNIVNGLAVHNRLLGFMTLVKSIWKDYIKVKSDMEVVFEKIQFPAIKHIDTKLIAEDLVPCKPVVLDLDKKRPVKRSKGSKAVKIWLKLQIVQNGIGIIWLSLQIKITGIVYIVRNILKRNNGIIEIIFIKMLGKKENEKENKGNYTIRDYKKCKESNAKTNNKV